MRIADQPTDVGRSAALAALIQALCAAAPAPAEGSERRLSLAAGRRCRARRGSDGGAARAGRAGGPRPRHVGARRDAARAAGGAAAARPRAVATGSSPWRPSSWRTVVSRLLRSALYPLRLVGARLGRRSAPVVLVVLGIAAGAAVVFGGRAGTLVAQDRARRPGDRADPGGEPLGPGGLVRHPRPEQRAPACARPPGARCARARRRRPRHARSSSSARPRSPARSPASAASKGSGTG